MDIQAYRSKLNAITVFQLVCLLLRMRKINPILATMKYSPRKELIPPNPMGIQNSRAKKGMMHANTASPLFLKRVLVEL
jgi:hypothetical protein